MDFSRFHKLTDLDREQLSHGRNTLLILTPSGGVQVHYPVGHDSKMQGDKKAGRLTEYVEAAKAAGVPIVDARQCDVGAYAAHMIETPLPAVGEFARQKVEFTADALGWISIEDHARSYTTIGARIINVTAANVEREE